MFLSFCSKKEFVEDLGVGPSSINFHLKKMLDLGVIITADRIDGKLVSYHKEKIIICKKPVKREIFYMWQSVQMKKDVYRLLITHKKSLLDPSVIDSYDVLVRETEIPIPKLKKLFGFNNAIDNVLKRVDEIFPFPYQF